jgi:hypothetical protein
MRRGRRANVTQPNLTTTKRVSAVQPSAARRSKVSTNPTRRDEEEKEGNPAQHEEEHEGQPNAMRRMGT